MDRETAYFYENLIRQHVEDLKELSLKSSRGVITPDNLVIYTASYCLQLIHKMVKNYPAGYPKTRLQEEIEKLTKSYLITNFDKQVTNFKQLEDYLADRLKVIEPVLSALCSLALDNPEDNAYAIISKYKES